MSKGPTDTKPPAERALLVLVNSDTEDDFYVEQELTSLAEAAGIEVAAFLRQRVDKPQSRTYIGKGKVEELHAAIKDEEADVAVFDCELSAVQQRNLSESLKVKVIDRTQLILDIFAQRAHTREGVLQVELAQYSYLLPKISSLYTQFERQKGGIGMRGPGEQKLEADRRRIKDRIVHLSRDLEDVRAQRGRQRAGRRKTPFPFACLVGYTSAGKSTLMNRLSGSTVFADPMLFATLDPTTRKIELRDGYSVFLTDTVGFVRNLPTNLVAAFRATLEEVGEADFLIHIIDVSHESWELQRDAVIETVSELGAGDLPMMTVFNKVDLLSDRTILRELVASVPMSVAISATKAIGMDDFQDALLRMIRSLLVPVEAIIPYAKSRLVQECYDFGRVLSVDHKEDGIHVRAELVGEMAARIKAQIAS